MWVVHKQDVFFWSNLRASALAERFGCSESRTYYSFSTREYRQKAGDWISRNSEKKKCFGFYFFRTRGRPPQIIPRVNIDHSGSSLSDGMSSSISRDNDDLEKNTEVGPWYLKSQFIKCSKPFPFIFFAMVQWAHVISCIPIVIICKCCYVIALLVCLHTRIGKKYSHPMW